MRIDNETEMLGDFVVQRSAGHVIRLRCPVDAAASGLTSRASCTGRLCTLRPYLGVVKFLADPPEPSAQPEEFRGDNVHS